MRDNLPHPPMAQPEPLGAHVPLEEAEANIEKILRVSTACVPYLHDLSPTLRAIYIFAVIRDTTAKFKFLAAANAFILIYRHSRPPPSCLSHFILQN